MLRLNLFNEKNYLGDIMRIVCHFKKFVISLIAISMLFAIGCASAPSPKSETVKPKAPKTIHLTEKFILDGHIRGAQGLSFSPVSPYLASGGWDNHIFVWNYDNGSQFLKINDAHNSDVVSLSYDSEKNFFASAGLDRTIKIWDANTGEIIKVFRGFKHNVIGVDVYRNGKNVWIAGAVLTGEVVVLDYNTGERYATFWHSSYATNVAFSPDGSMLASTGNDRVIYLWDLAKKEKIRKFEGHTAKVNTVAFNPDGTSIASGSWDNTVRVWEVATGKELYNFESFHTDAVEQVQFSLTEPFLISGARDGFVNIFNVDNGEKMVQYDTGNTRVYNVIFNDDSSKVALTGYDHMVRVYDLIQK